jgi:hypothetical protein
MNHYQLMIPLITLFLGALIMTGIEITGDEARLGNQWITHTFVLVLALLQQTLLYRMPTTVYVRGGMILDGASQLFSICILILGLAIQLNRSRGLRPMASQVGVLTLAATLFGLLAVQSNRILFSVLAVVGMTWAAQGALSEEAEAGSQPALVHSGLVRGMVFLLCGAVLCIMSFALFGDTQLDEIQKALVRGKFQDYPLYAVQVLLLFLGAMVMGIPPFQALFGKARRRASWSLSIGFTALFAIVGLSIIVRSIYAFSRPGVGGVDLEPLTKVDIAATARLIGGLGLVLVPLLSLINRKLRGSFTIFILNPFVQALFAASFVQREVLGLSLGLTAVATITAAALISATEALKFSHAMTLQEWVGIGRRDRTACIAIVLALASAAGLAPFYGALVMQKTLSINSLYALVFIANIALSGFYVARFIIYGFHRPDGESSPLEVSMGLKVWFVTQVVLLIFMGIFWQPLYKYGAFSVRSFFGEM